MTCALTVEPLHICKGATWTQVFAWESENIVYKPITAVSLTAPVGITAIGHGLVTGWRAAIESISGTTEINSQHTPPRTDDYHVVKVTSANAITMDDINAIGLSAYKSGGTLVYNAPVDLTAADSYLVFLDKENGTEIQRLTVSTGITINNTTKTITATMSTANTDALTFNTGYYLLFGLIGSTLTVLFEGEVTTDNLIV